MKRVENNAMCCTLLYDGGYYLGNIFILSLYYCRGQKLLRQLRNIPLFVSPQAIKNSLKISSGDLKRI